MPCRISSWNATALPNAGGQGGGFAGGQWPRWHDRFPDLEFEDFDPDGFPGKERVAAYLEAYARKCAAPVRTGVDVRKLCRNEGRPGFAVTTSDGLSRQIVWWWRQGLSASGDSAYRAEGRRADADSFGGLP